MVYTAPYPPPPNKQGKGEKRYAVYVEEYSSYGNVLYGGLFKLSSGLVQP